MTAMMVPFFDNNSLTRKGDIKVKDLPNDVFSDVTGSASAGICRLGMRGDGGGDWSCTRVPNHKGWCVATYGRGDNDKVLAMGPSGKSIVQSSYALALEYARPIFKASEEEIVNLKVVKLDITSANENWFEYGIGQALLLTDLPVPDYSEIDKARQCEATSPELGWPCTREKSHTAPHRSTNFEIQRVYAKWPR